MGSRKGIWITELEKSLKNLLLSTLTVLSELKNSFMKFNKSQLLLKLDKYIQNY